jgi:hypothetical protein
MRWRPDRDDRQLQLHKGQIQPAAKFGADLRHLPGGDKAQRFMQMQRGLVLRFNTGHHDMFIQATGLGDQRDQQAAAQSFTLMIGWT